jgi:2-C-methyl-D-erythritol 4-phosphate cytidylyltransferase
MMENKQKISVILLAGGKGSRMQAQIPKQYLPLKGKPLALYSFEIFLQLPEIHEIVVVCSKEYESLFQSAHKKITFAEPGERRQDSVYNGLQAIEPDTEFVCIHDSARPHITPEIVRRALEAGQLYGAATVGVQARNTIKECNEFAFVKQTPDRSRVWEIQTPQVLRASLLREGFKQINKKNLTVTDDVSIVEHMKFPVKIVEGDIRNIKITSPEDLLIAEHFLTYAEV